MTISSAEALRRASDSALPSHMDRLFIDGKWVPSSEPSRLRLVDPCTEECFAEVAEAGEQDIDAAVAAAESCFEIGTWRKTGTAERSLRLHELSRILKDRAEEFARLCTREMGAPIQATRSSAFAAATIFQSYAQMTREFAFESRVPRASGHAMVLQEPVGVVAAITPWNAPYTLMASKVAPALAAGCAVVIKPAPEAPLTALLFAECLAGLDFPPGLVNVVPAGRKNADRLLRHPAVDKVAFTGSTATGKHVAAVCSERIARTSLELGGKSAAIVLDDMPADEVAKRLLPGATMLTGQACVALSRVLVPRSRRQEITDALIAQMRQIRIGDPFDEATEMGPLATATQRNRVESFIRIGCEEGATLALGGGRPPGFEVGYFISPTLFCDATNRMKIAREEIFGPVITLIEYDSEDDAVTIANDTPYGLNGAVFTMSEERAMQIARRVRVGSFTHNGLILDRNFPFGGFKQSGVGRENGESGLAGYLETKVIYMNGAG